MKKYSNLNDQVYDKNVWFDHLMIHDWIVVLMDVMFAIILEIIGHNDVSLKVSPNMNDVLYARKHCIADHFVIVVCRSIKDTARSGFCANTRYLIEADFTGPS
ncbi:hypothetical protein DERP_005062 [Dermatophagoides pteronyssinus]|uniref:Uncharacterized protein n=1 Tax=Dermatophagoides pteronyssinus TaxID=6956 RepID=A0ABQ8JTA2_DERPT|nr:hypothetical protein DERP_005062 [Dermatophagoides pteronyssinus]